MLPCVLSIQKNTELHLYGTHSLNQSHAEPYIHTHPSIIILLKWMKNTVVKLAEEYLFETHLCFIENSMTRQVISNRFFGVYTSDISLTMTNYAYIFIILPDLYKPYCAQADRQYKGAGLHLKKRFVLVVFK